MLKLIKSNSQIAAGAAIFLLAFIVFLTSPVHQLADSNYSMLVSQNLIQHHSFALDSYAIPRLTPVEQKGFISNGNLYQLELVGNHIYYYFPPGSSILSVPFVAVMNAFGVLATNPDGTYNPHGEIKIEASLAALLMAVLASLFFYTSRLMLPFRWSVAIALSGAFGTQVWSTASRALWSDTWGIFLIGIVVYMLVIQAVSNRDINPILLATLLSWTYFVRPTYCIPIAAITIYMLLYYRQLLARYITTGAVWLMGFSLYSWIHFGKVLPSYYGNRLSLDSFWEALAGNLISPSRGLIVFVPSVCFVAYLLIRYKTKIASPRLVVLCLSIIMLHLLVISCFVPWYGGHSYGPRYTTGIVPWLVLLSILAVKARQLWIESPDTKKSYQNRNVELTLGSLLLVCSMIINGSGATARRTWLWNIRPVDVDDQPSRVWDWRTPQFLAE